MNWLLWIYIVIYAGISIAGVWSDVRSKYAHWIVAVDLLASVYGVAVMVMFALDFKPVEWMMFFQYAYPAYVFSLIFVSVIDLVDEWKEDPSDRKMTVIGGLLAFAVELPAFFICYQFAFG